MRLITSWLLMPHGHIVRAPAGKQLQVTLIDLPMSDEEMRLKGRPSRDGKVI